MAEESLRELRRKHNEERKEEMSSLITIMMSLAQRDCFPTDIMIKNVDQNGCVQDYQFDFANPWYVSEPVSTIQSASVVINDRTVKPEQMTIIIRDQRIPMMVARTFYELWWGFGEIARISFSGDSIPELKTGEKIDLEFHFSMRTTMNYGIKDNLAPYVMCKRLEVEQHENRN